MLGYIKANLLFLFTKDDIKLYNCIEPTHSEYDHESFHSAVVWVSIDFFGLYIGGKTDVMLSPDIGVATFLF